MLPGRQESRIQEERVGDDRQQQADKAANHREERQHHADDELPQVQREACRHGRQEAAGLGREVDEGDRQDWMGEPKKALVMVGRAV